MSKGYMVIAQNTNDVDYFKMAYTLALSIKTTQTEVNETAIALTNTDELPKEYKHVFDHIIEIPWGDHAIEAEWKIQNKWKYFYMTPFKETVILDADMLFTEDISYWWKFLSTKDIWATSHVKTFRGDTVTSTYYRKTFQSNDLPNVYTAFMYFKECELAAQLFKMVEIIFRHWERYYYLYLDETRPKHLSGDVSFALAMKLLGIESKCISDTETELPTFTHMKSYVQNIPQQYLTEKWDNHLPTYFTNDCKLKVGNYKQRIPFHYHLKDWITDDIITKLETKKKEVYGK